MKRIISVLLVLLLAGNLAGAKIEGNNGYIISSDRTIDFYLINDSSSVKEYYIRYYCGANLKIKNYVAVGKNSTAVIPVKVLYKPENNSYKCMLVAENSSETIAKSFDLEFKDKSIFQENKNTGIITGFFSLSGITVTFLDIILAVIVVLLLLAFVTRFVNYKGVKNE